MRRFILTVALAGAAAPALTAQSAPVSRDDSLGLGRRYVKWVYENRADSLWEHLGEDLRKLIGSKDVMVQENDQLAIMLGSEVEVLQETVSAQDGDIVYVREARFDGKADEPMVWHWTIAPDGKVKMARLRPKSQMTPPTAPAAPPAAPAAKPGS